MVKNIGKNFIHFSTSNFPRMCDGGQPDIISVYSEWEKGCICIFFLIFIQQAWKSNHFGLNKAMYLKKECNLSRSQTIYHILRSIYRPLRLQKDKECVQWWVDAGATSWVALESSSEFIGQSVTQLNLSLHFFLFSCKLLHIFFSPLKTHPQKMIAMLS